jgi:hypothetical protein
MIQEGFDLPPAHGVRVALPMEIDELPDPETVAVFSTGAKVPAVADETWSSRWGARGLAP